MIDAVYCLCIDKRKDLWPALENDVKLCLGMKMRKFIAGDGADQSLKYNHIDLPYNVYMNRYCIYGSPQTIKNHANAFLCHKKILHTCMNKDYNKVLLLEDDARLLRNRFNTIFDSEKVTSFIESDYWDIIYLGWWLKLTSSSTEDREDLEEKWKNNREYSIDPIPRPPTVAHEICGLHGVLINKHMIEILANAPYGPLDSYINRNFNNIGAYYIWPKIIHTPSNFSYCEESYYNRNVLE